MGFNPAFKGLTLTGEYANANDFKVRLRALTDFSNMILVQFILV